jgi:hypothetical protein
METAFRLNDLNAAIAAEYAIAAEALQKGLVATKPLSVIRLAELCALGEQMIRAQRRTAEAYSAAYPSRRRELLDIVLSREST